VGVRQPALIDVAVRRVGMLQGSRAIAVMLQWETARDALGEDWPHGVEAQVRAYADWWRFAERTGWNDLRRFREAFPGEDTPERLSRLAMAEWDRRRGVKGLGAVPYPGAAAA
jgi:hypothetical protein